MGLFDWLFGRQRKLQTQRTSASPLLPARRVVAKTQPAYAVIDVETTGLSSRADRVLELAIVRVDHSGEVVDEWVSRFNPEGPVGATHIHGIRPEDVLNAPRFADVASTVAGLLSGLPIVAHNARFDLAFLRSEFSSAGWQIPWLSAYCTLAGSRHYHPYLDRRRLADCCAAFSVALVGAHSALGDARATAGLLRAYLAGPNAKPVDQALQALRAGSPIVTAPARLPPVARAGADRGSSKKSRNATPPPNRTRTTVARPPQPQLLAQVTRVSLLELLDEGAPAGATAYLELLLEAVEDGEISESESMALNALREDFGLSEADVHSANTAFLLALAHRAADDGRISRAERDELTSLAGVLSVSTAVVKAVLDQAQAARHARLDADLGPLPNDWAHGEPLRVGDRIAFTGCDDVWREQHEHRARELGVRVMNNVSRLTVLLVSDGSVTGAKSSKADEHRTRIVHPELFEMLIKHLQPSSARESAGARFPSSDTLPESTERATNALDLSSRAVRAWARANGHAVGDRGRIPQHITEAYQRHMA